MGDIMEHTTLSIRIDSGDKKGFEKLCSNTGINVSTAINMLIKKVLKEQKLPFDIQNSNYDDFDDEVYSKLLEADKEMSKSTKRYTNDEVIERLNKSIG